MDFHVVIAIWFVAQGDGVAFGSAGENVPALLRHWLYPSVLPLKNLSVFMPLAEGCRANRLKTSGLLSGV
jgi:hypothetical protein